MQKQQYNAQTTRRRYVWMNTLFFCFCDWMCMWSWGRIFCGMFLEVWCVFSLQKMLVTPERAAQIVALIEEGHSRCSLAREFNLGESSVQYMYNQYVATGSYTHMLQTDRPQATTAWEDRNIAHEAMRNPFLMTTTIAQYASTSRDTPVTSRMVQRWLKEKNLRSYKPAMGPILMRQHCAARMSPGPLMIGIVSYSLTSLVSHCIGPTVVIECGGGRELDINSKILFDDRIFSVVREWLGRHTGWCEAGTLYVWQGSAESWDILWGNSPHHVVPFAPFVRENFLLQQDNARPYVTRVARDFLETVGIKALEWPAFSPDLNPIEHLWDKMGSELWKCNPLVLLLNKLRQALEEIWEAIPQEDVWALIESTPPEDGSGNQSSWWWHLLLVFIFREF